jgi:hypothetical protein
MAVRRPNDLARSLQQFGTNGLVRYGQGEGTVDKNRFLELQYLTLRKEIEDSLARAFQIMIGSAALIPLLVGIIGHYTATPILMTLPMMVVVSALLYLNQWNSIMRCGRYIRMKIEPQIVGNQGWEGWLESHPDTQMGTVHNRLVDTYLQYAFYLLTAAYYSATSYIGVLYAYRSYGSVGEWLSLGVYIAVGLGMGVIIVFRVPTHTTTKEERLLTEQQVEGPPLGLNSKDISIVDAIGSSPASASPSVVFIDEGTPLSRPHNQPVKSAEPQGEGRAQSS